MTDYGIILRRFIDFTGSKLYAVADEIGYDVSYVSKWCNKDLLPAPKTAATVNKLLVCFFATNIRQDGRENEFFAAFPGCESGHTVEQHICTLLTKAYEASAHTKTTSASSKIELLTHRNQMLSSLQEFARHRLTAGGEVFCSIDLLTLLQSRDCTVLEQLAGDMELHFHAALNMERFQKDPIKNLGLLYGFLTRYPTFYLTLYDGSGLEGEGMIAAKNGGALMAALSPKGELDALLVLEPGENANQLYKTVMARLKECPLLLSPATPESMNNNGYRTDFYSRDQYKFFSPYGFEFLLPESICSKLIQAGEADAPNPALSKFIRRLFITWEEVFEKSHIDFYLLKSSVLRYLESGDLLFADIMYQMSPSERLEHLENIKKQVMHNPEIRFIVLDDDTFSPSFAPTFSVYINPQKLFLKNPAAYQTKKGPLFYTVQNETLLQAASQYLDSTLSHSSCKVYDSKSLEELENRYGGMLYRMLTL